MGRIVTLVAAIAIGLVIVKTLPDFTRYLKIRSM